MRFVSYGDRDAVAPMLRPIYTAANTVLTALGTLADSILAGSTPTAVATWENAWDLITPFLPTGSALCKVI